MPTEKTLDTDGTKATDEQTFTADQSTGSQSVTVGGSAPAGGFINFDVKEGNTVLKSAKYSDGEFNAQAISYKDTAEVAIPPPSKTNEGFELQFGINFLGQFALTGLLYPILDAQLVHE